MAEVTRIPADGRSDERSLHDMDWEDDEQIAAMLRRDPDFFLGEGSLVESRTKDTITLMDAQKRAARDVSIIFQSWLRLRYIVGQHGTAIQR